MKLYLQYAKELLPPQIFERLFRNCVKYKGADSLLFQECGSKKQFADRFWLNDMQGAWLKTPEGENFWLEVSRVIKRAPELRWPEIPNASK